MDAIQLEPQTVTVGFISRALGVSRDRVKNILRSRPHIASRSIGWASSTRIYSKDVIALVRHELNAIDARSDAGDDDTPDCPLFNDEGAAA